MEAALSFDIWSFGVVLFELCSGQTLFSQDISNDELITQEDKTRLCTWNVVTDFELGPVLSQVEFCEEVDSAEREERFKQLDVDKSGFLDLLEVKKMLQDMGKFGAKELQTAMEQMDASGNGQVSYADFDQWYLSEQPGQIVLDAKNLIRWCLQGDPQKRPTIEQVLQHAFLRQDAPTPPDDQRMRYHAFLSHAQGDASGTANTLFFAYEQLGLHCWIDMRQDDLTIQGMRQGVCDSDVFLLILSEKVLSS